MQSIKAARVELAQEHIDFYRPVSHKEVVDETDREIKAKCRANILQR